LGLAALHSVPTLPSGNLKNKRRGMSEPHRAGDAFGRRVRVVECGSCRPVRFEDDDENPVAELYINLRARAMDSHAVATFRVWRRA
jgi:hypothetical protein